MEDKVKLSGLSRAHIHAGIHKRRVCEQVYAPTPLCLKMKVKKSNTTCNCANIQPVNLEMKWELSKPTDIKRHSSYLSSTENI